MRLTRRSWAVGGLAVLLATFAIAFARPLLLAGTVLIGGWLLTRQFLFVRELTTTVDALTVEQQLTKTSLHTNETTTVTTGAHLDDPVSLSLSLEAGLPTGAVTVTEDALRLELEPTETTGQCVGDVRWPIAGRHEFKQATLTVTDGLFTETLPVGSTPTVTVEPRSPRRLHIGAGGDRIPMAHGEHVAGRASSGLIPAELREYVPGETVAKIDWKATARLSTPHVREYDAETDRVTILFLDHSSSVTVGPPNETQLEYLREAALLLAGTARGLGDPLGLVGIGDDGITTQIGASSGPKQYERIRRQLLELEATTPQQATAETRASAAVTDGGNVSRGPHGQRPPIRSGTRDARYVLRQLETVGGPIADTLTPFYAARDRYHERADEETHSLPFAVQSATARQRTSIWAVILTTDAHPDALRRAVGTARAEENEVVVFITPTVLFEPGGLADLEAAYDRYVEFESLRRTLDRMDGVTAFEVAPGDRLATVLGAGRHRRGGAPS